MGKKIMCSSTPRGIKSKDQRGGKKSKVAQLYSPLQCGGSEEEMRWGKVGGLDIREENVSNLNQEERRK